MMKRQLTASAWGGLDTLHILAGVPSTSTLMEAAGVTLKPADPTGSSSTTTTSSSPKFKFERMDGTSKSSSPDKAGMDRIAVEARTCAEINYLGAVLALACFVSVGEACCTCPVQLLSVACDVSREADIHAIPSLPSLPFLLSALTTVPAPAARFVVAFPGSTPPLLGGSDDTRPLPSHLLRHQGRSIHGLRGVSGGV
jgi:hypothetical protein